MKLGGKFRDEYIDVMKDADIVTGDKIRYSNRYWDVKAECSRIKVLLGMANG